MATSELQLTIKPSLSPRELDDVAALVREARWNQLAADWSIFLALGRVYALQSGRFARVLACEPEPKNLQLLEMNTAANGLSSRVRIIPKALGAQAGTATLHLHPRNKGGHSLRWNPSYDGKATVDVPVVRLDALLQEEAIAAETIGVVWIDTEGFEPQVVEGLGDFLGRVPLAIEYAPKRYAPAYAARLRELLQQHYQTFHLLSGDRPSAQPISALAALTGITDVLVF